MQVDRILKTQLSALTHTLRCRTNTVLNSSVVLREAFASTHQSTVFKLITFTMARPQTSAFSSACISPINPSYWVKQFSLFFHRRIV